MNFKSISSVVSDEFAQVDSFITQQLQSKVPLIVEIGEYIVNSGGKRLRPLISLLSARATGYQGQQHINVAAIIEFLHTSTLLHDDVVDGSELRRGRPTANAVWGNQAAILVGDFLISRAFQLVVEVGDIRLMQILADGTNVISEGEVLQMLNAKDPTTTEERYYQVIHHKTAKMFESAAQTGAVLGTDATNSSQQQHAEQLKQAFGDYGRHLGMAFQLVDDVLDYDGNPEELGKNVGDDLAEGKPTLPLIYTMAQGSKADAEMIRDAIRHGSVEKLDAIVACVKRCGGIEYTMQKAALETQAAIAALQDQPQNQYTQALKDLATLAISRNN